MTEGEMASLTQWPWVWASSGRWWRTGKPGMLQSMGSQRVGHNWETKQQLPQVAPPDSLPLLKTWLWEAINLFLQCKTMICVWPVHFLGCAALQWGLRICEILWKWLWLDPKTWQFKPMLCLVGDVIPSLQNATKPPGQHLRKMIEFLLHLTGIHYFKIYGAFLL